MVAVVALRVRCEPYRRHRPRDSSAAEYTCGMNLGKSLMSLATAPARVGPTADDGLIERVLAEDGLADRLLAEDGLADRLLAEGGLIDKLTARNGPLEQLADVADTLSRLAPGMEALEPAIATLQDAVMSLTM